MEERNGQPKYDLEERTFQFARRARQFVRRAPKTLSNYEDSRQLIRASGSVGANYIEANESLGKKDFLLHVRISCQEAKESRYWLQLLDLNGSPTGELELERAALVKEATELVRIFASIVRNRRD